MVLGSRGWRGRSLIAANYWLLPTKKQPLKKQKLMSTKNTENELLFTWIVNIGFRYKLSSLVIEARDRRKKYETQKQVADVLGIPLTEVKQIENGTSEDVNAIVNYLVFQGISL